MGNNLNESAFLPLTYLERVCHEFGRRMSPGKGGRRLLASGGQKVENVIPRKVEAYYFRLRARLSKALTAGFKNGASDGARTRDLRRDRPAL